MMDLSVKSKVAGSSRNRAKLILVAEMPLEEEVRKKLLKKTLKRFWILLMLMGMNKLHTVRMTIWLITRDT